MRIAIVHYWLLEMRGGEKVLEALCRMYPEADLFTLFYSPQNVSPVIRSHRVTASFLNAFRRFHRGLLPLMPLAVESFDLRDYDLVISSESGPAKGALVPSAARHVCYCHSPMRYLWELYPQQWKEWSLARRALTAPVANYLRVWDHAAAARVDTFVANSHNVRRRIFRAYHRDSEVVYPPVAVEQFYWKPPADYYLTVSKLVPYKRIDLAVRACRASGRPLKVVGDGPEFARLKRLAGPETEFCGNVSETDLRELYARCRALIVPADEDFGIATVEALASGKGVIALRKGGSLEIASEPGSGVFFDRQDLDAVMVAMEEFEKMETRVESATLRARAQRFSEEVFVRSLRTILDRESA